MQCSFLIAASFIFCAVAYGASSAAVSEALKSFTPELIIIFRMLFGFAFCLIVLICRYIANPSYRQVVRAHFCSGFWPIFHLCIGGLLNLGIPHSLIAIAQQWIPSAAVQLSKPLTPAASALCGLCCKTDEKFTHHKLYALICSIIGVALTAIPSFLHAGSSTVPLSDVIIGYVLLIFSMALFGIAAVYFKWKTPNTDITISSMMQTGFSFIFDFIWAMIMDGPDLTFTKIRNAPPLAWLWPILLGVLASGVAVHGFMYLVNTLGAVGANFIPFGQILVGVTIGITILGEWDAYRWWEILLSCIGILFLCGAILIGFLHDKELDAKPDEEEEKHEEEEDKNVHLSEL